MAAFYYRKSCATITALQPSEQSRQVDTKATSSVPMESAPGDDNVGQSSDEAGATETIPRLPAEIWLAIMDLMPTIDRLKLAQTCSMLRSILNEPCLWTERHVTIHRRGCVPLNDDEGRRLRTRDLRRKNDVYSPLAQIREHIPGLEHPMMLQTFKHPSKEERENDEEPLYNDYGTISIRSPPRQRLSQMSLNILPRFGHHIQHLSLLVQFGCVGIHRESVRILRELSSDWELKTLTMTLDSFQHDIPDCLKTIPHSESGLNIANEILRKATNLQKLDIQLWNVPVKRLTDMWAKELGVFRRQGLHLALPVSMGIEKVLMESPTCPGLRELDIAGQPPCSIMSAHDTISCLVYKFCFLSRLVIRHFMLCDGLMHRLAERERVPLKMLEVQAFREPTDCCWSTFFEPQVEKASWIALTSSCPELRVHVVIRSNFVIPLKWALVDWVPVGMLTLAEDANPEFDLSQASYWQRTLTKIAWLAPCAFRLDQDLLNLATVCTSLQYLTIVGKVNCTLLKDLEKLKRQWISFRFPQHTTMHRIFRDISPSYADADCPLAMS